MAIGVNTIEQRLFFKNRSSKRNTVIVEPWAEEWAIDPGQSIELVGSGPAHDAKFEISIEAQCISVFAWSKSIVKVLIDGKHVVSGSEGFPSP